MIKMTLHQLWNQRRQNGWIFMELLLAGFFLWMVIDPIYVLIANRCIDRGYDPSGAYVVRMGVEEEGQNDADGVELTDSLRKEQLWHVVRILRQQPEVADYAITTTWSFPHSGSWHGNNVYADTASTRRDKGMVQTQFYDFVAAEGSNIFSAYGMTDALTGGKVQLPADMRGKTFISERLAQLLYGTTDAIGRKIYFNEDNVVEVAGVFRNFKHRDYEQPYSLMVFADADMEAGSYMEWKYNFVLRLKKGVDAVAFEKRFAREVAPTLSVGNFYLNDLPTFSELSDRQADSSGITNKFRLQYALAGFAVLCIFLGMLGTFWVRCNARRKEIGLMTSIGASRATICRQFLAEAWLLVTMAFVLVLPPLLHQAFTDGLYALKMNDAFIPDSTYVQNIPALHFLIVSILTYLLLLIVALVGTYIPAYRAARTLPAEALRDE